MSKLLQLRLQTCHFFRKMKAWPLPSHLLCVSHGMSELSSVEVLENVWLHIRGLFFMSKAARNAASSCREDLIFKVVLQT